MLEARIDLSVGTVGDACENALAECIIHSGAYAAHWSHGRLHMFKTEVINQIGPWKSMLEVEWETLKRVDRYDNVRGLSRTNGVHPLTLLGPIGYVTPAEAEEAFHANLKTPDRVAWSLNKSPCGKTGAVHR